MKNIREVFLADTDQSYMSGEKKGADDNVYRNRTTVENIKEGDDNIAMDVWLDYSIGVAHEKDYDGKRA